ncbi:NADH-quinone oxidoreductase subunit M [Segetibacter sp. 3557_3]|uniref:complex I subunit 4 family protein n=1 Tax=Segetibacter sp. 3557_3 TaxID=2547429 RepID=UPI001058418E|nr:NADH-quinone oxidoreductase subunit M [Segetibacter sp. 3557_3]TDH25508.1 NADH-quinone oxidoreductase subunit M [Segetibacter sp. 3557_3]
MIPVLLILVPLISGLVTLFLRQEKVSKTWALFSSVITLAIAIFGAASANTSGNLLAFDASWVPTLGARFTFGLDGMGKVLTLLTAIAFPVIFASTFKNRYSGSNAFYGLMLFSQAGLMGVFLAMDLLLFYFFWELALIPVYFLCSRWGGERRIAVTWKFFIYTFAGSLLMLAGILYLYYQTPDHSFAMRSLYNIELTQRGELFVFWTLFIAFAIKMPVFPFHTWQPDTYEQSPTAVTMVLSGVMVKMGVFAVLRWLIPIVPNAAVRMSDVVIIFSIIGMLYASLIAIRQDDIKRLIAYSSIAHIGLMSAAMFADEGVATQGVVIQMFSHGINVIGLWIVADLIEQQLGTRKFSELGGLAQKAPTLAILFVVMALANVALPLTNAFVGEFLMFNGLFRYNHWMAGIAGISIILVAVYTLWMVQKVFYGEARTGVEMIADVSPGAKYMLITLVLVVIVFGVYPQPLINLTNDATKILAQLK